MEAAFEQFPAFAKNTGPELGTTSLLQQDNVFRGDMDASAEAGVLTTWRAGSGFFDLTLKLGQIKAVKAEDVCTNDLIKPANDFDHAKVKADADAYKLTDAFAAIDVENVRRICSTTRCRQSGVAIFAPSVLPDISPLKGRLEAIDFPIVERRSAVASMPTLSPGGDVSGTEGCEETPTFILNKLSEGTMPDKVKILVVGLGNMGASHASAYHRNPGFEIVGLMSRSIKATKIPDELSRLPLYEDFDQALKEAKPDAVSINSWPNTAMPNTR